VIASKSCGTYWIGATLPFRKLWIPAGLAPCASFIWSRSNSSLHHRRKSVDCEGLGTLLHVLAHTTSRYGGDRFAVPLSRRLIRRPPPFAGKSARATRSKGPVREHLSRREAKARQKTHEISYTAWRPPNGLDFTTDPVKLRLGESTAAGFSGQEKEPRPAPPSELSCKCCSYGGEELIADAIKRRPQAKATDKSSRNRQHVLVCAFIHGRPF